MEINQPGKDEALAYLSKPMEQQSWESAFDPERN